MLAYSYFVKGDVFGKLFVVLFSIMAVHLHVLQYFVTKIVNKTRVSFKPTKYLYEIPFRLQV
jgi:hypothetical protein